MADVDTENKRRSLGAYSMGWVGPKPDGGIEPGDRRHIAWLYRAPVYFDDELGVIAGIVDIDSAVQQIWDEQGLLAAIASLDAVVVNVYDEATLIEGILELNSQYSKTTQEVGLIEGILSLDSPDEFVFGNIHFPYNTLARLTPVTPLTGRVRQVESSSVVTSSTENKRRSIGGYALSWLAPRPDGTIGTLDRRHLAWLYPGPFAGAQGSLGTTSIRARQDNLPLPGRARVLV